MLLAHASLGRRLLPTAWIDDDGRCSCMWNETAMDVTCSKGKPGKHPRIKDWDTRASCHPDEIVEWHQWQPLANWAWMQTETFAIDVDPDRGGLESLTQWETHADGPGHTLTQKTQSGGYHFIYQQPEVRVPTLKDFLPGIEVRGIGSYIMIEPSVGLNGTWEFVDKSVEPQEADDFTMRMIRTQQSSNVSFGADGRRRADPNRDSDLPPTEWFMVHGFGGYTGSRNADAYKLSWRLLALQQSHPGIYTTDVLTDVMRRIWSVTDQEDHPFEWVECLFCMRSAFGRRQRQQEKEASEMQKVVTRWRAAGLL